MGEVAALKTEGTFNILANLASVIFRYNDSGRGFVTLM
jgi:hypothetical protein